MNDVTLPTPLQPTRRTPTWVRLLLMFVIFFSGMVVGAYSTGVLIRGKVMESIKTPETVPPRIAARLRRILDLSEEQTAQVTAILDRRRLEIQTIRREFQPRIEEQLNEAQSEIATILSEQQRTLWQQHFAEMRATWLPPLPK